MDIWEILEYLKDIPTSFNFNLYDMEDDLAIEAEFFAWGTELFCELVDEEESDMVFAVYVQEVFWSEYDEGPQFVTKLLA